MQPINWRTMSFMDGNPRQNLATFCQTWVAHGVEIRVSRDLAGDLMDHVAHAVKFLSSRAFCREAAGGWARPDWSSPSRAGGR